MDGEIMTLEEVAAFLKVGEQTVYDLARRGEIPGRKVGREWRFFRHALIHWFMDSEPMSPEEENMESTVQRDEWGGEYKLVDGAEKISLWLPMGLEEKKIMLEKAAKEEVMVSELVAQFLRNWMEK